MELRKLAEQEDYALPRPVNTSRKVDPEERPDVEVKRRRFKVWKTKGWKRRKNLRAERAASYHELVKSL